jgi:hypothetical protein
LEGFFGLGDGGGDLLVVGFDVGEEFAVVGVGGEGEGEQQSAGGVEGSYVHAFSFRDGESLAEEEWEVF